MDQLVSDVIDAVAIPALLLFPVWAIVCFVLGAIKRWRLSIPVFIMGLVPPFCALIWGAWDWRTSMERNGDETMLFYGGLATAMVLIVGFVGTRRRWRGAQVVSFVGLGVPLLVAVPLLFFFVALFLQGGME